MNDRNEPAGQGTAGSPPEPPDLSIESAFRQLREAIENMTAGMATMQPLLRLDALQHDAAGDADPHEDDCACNACFAAHCRVSEDVFEQDYYEAGKREARAAQAKDAFLAALDEPQRALWASAMLCDVVGNVTGDTYRLQYGMSGNITRHRDLQRFCLVARSRFAPTWAIMRVQLWLITHDEGQFLTKANALGAVYFLPGTIPPPRADPWAEADRAQRALQEDIDRAVLAAAAAFPQDVEILQGRLAQPNGIESGSYTEQPITTTEQPITTTDQWGIYRSPQWGIYHYPPIVDESVTFERVTPDDAVADLRRRELDRAHGLAQERVGIYGSPEAREEARRQVRLLNEERRDFLRRYMRERGAP